MFVCYLDDSENSQGPSMAIAGYAAELEDWRAFESEIDPFLSRAGVTILRGKDFHNGHGDFKNWTRNQKLVFVEQLFEIAKRHNITGVTTTIQKEFYKNIGYVTKNCAMYRH